MKYNKKFSIIVAIITIFVFTGCTQWKTQAKVLDTLANYTSDEISIVKSEENKNDIKYFAKIRNKYDATIIDDGQTVQIDYVESIVKGNLTYIESLCDDIKVKVEYEEDSDYLLKFTVNSVEDLNTMSVLITNLDELFSFKTQSTSSVYDPHEHLYNLVVVGDKKIKTPEYSTSSESRLNVSDTNDYIMRQYNMLKSVDNVEEEANKAL